MLETSRLILKPATIEDADNLFQLNSDPEVMRYTGDKKFHSTLEAQKIINENLIPQFNHYKMGRFMIFLKDGTFIGWCGLKYFLETDEVDLGYRLKRSYWGQGFATEASKACLEYGFKVLRINRIIAKAMPENIGSIKVMQKLGMTFRGYLRDPTDPQSFILYDIFKSEQYP
jgi:RimJ/RimL family protein N-acetyltransferase